MKALKIAVFALVVVAVGCINITVRVTFPEAQFQAAADKIVDKVQGGAQEKPKNEGGPSSALPQPDWLASFSLISTAYANETAGGNIDITIENAEIEAIQERLQKNFEEYKPYKDNGSVGENLKGYLEERTEGSSKLESADQKSLRKLIKRENSDRKDLYMALLEANGYDKSQLSKIEEIFAKSWYGKSDAAWYVRYNDPDEGLIWLTRAQWDEKQNSEENP